MTKQEQIKEIDKYSERRINYCVRIQEAFNYKGNYDHEDIPSILVDFEREIKNDILPKDSVVLTREEYEMLITQYKNLEIKYSNLSDNYRLCKEANETIKQFAVIARKQAVKDFAEKLKEKALSHCRTINCYELKFIEETIDELLKEYEK